MRALKLVQRMKTNSEEMSEQLVQKIRASGKCTDLMLKVPESDQKKYVLAIFRDLTEWLSDESAGILKQNYVDIGSRRLTQGVPAGDMYWATAIARDYLWDYMQQECLHDEVVDFWGGVMLLRSLTRFFDRVFYSALLGYEKAGNAESAALSFLSHGRSA